MSPQIQEIIALAMAVVLGAMIGLEREINGKPAGLRTNILICLGAAAFTVISKHLGTELGAGPGRMAAGIVAGVGFLGAGALIHEGSGIHGLTTAASIWLVASIGVACGAGLYLIAVVVTAMALFVLLCLSPITKRLHKKIQKENT
ncbi:MAG: MgtC/SapB family protein [Sedimentisphaerales bacterium]|nr:MgtC/SapB family protein [Sedimentisphaerales bacterium]